MWLREVRRCELELADPAIFGRGQAETTLFVSTGKTELNARRPCTDARTRGLVDVGGSRLPSVHPFLRSICDIIELTELRLNACDAVGEDCELLGLADGHIAKEGLKRCAPAGRHAGAREAIACGITNGRTHGKSALTE